MNANTVRSFPFCAIQGQALLKRALLLCAINPALGGVLISGPRGSAKTTLARALADLLPQDASASAFVTLPLGASEDMLIGSLDVQRALDDKTLAFSPGLLAKADGGVLYVDEVNLLPDPLIDQLLDVAASGVNRVERDGVSHSHSARFSLIGTMNPDEGELRAQLLDRFGLMVNLDEPLTLEERVAVVTLREAFDRDPIAFCAEREHVQQALRERIAKARTALVHIECAPEQRLQIAKCCSDAQVDGVRADIVLYRAALAHAAWRDSAHVEAIDIETVAPLVLAHRRRQTPPNHSQQPPSSPPNGGNFQRPAEPESPSSARSGGGDWGAMSKQQTPPASAEQHTEQLRQLEAFFQSPSAAAQPYTAAQFSPRRGKRSAGYTPTGHKSERINWLRTLAQSVTRWPELELVRQRRRDGEKVLHLLLLDTSASTLSQQLSARAKSLVLAIAKEAYLKRDEFQLLTFGGERVAALFSSSRALKSMRRHIDGIQVGGGTPLRAALEQAAQVIKRQLPSGQSIRCYLVTDGRSRADVADLALPVHTLVIDTEHASVKRGRAAQIAQQLGAGYVPLHSTGARL